MEWRSGRRGNFWRKGNNLLRQTNPTLPAPPIPKVDHSLRHKGSPFASLSALTFGWRSACYQGQGSASQHHRWKGSHGQAFSVPPQLPLHGHIKTHLFVLIAVSWSQGQGPFLTQLCLLIAASARTCKWQIHRKCFLNWTASLVSLEGPLSTGVMKPRLTNNYWAWWIEAPSNRTQKYNTTELKPTEIQIAISLKKLPQKKSSKTEI